MKISSNDKEKSSPSEAGLKISLAALLLVSTSFHASNAQEQMIDPSIQEAEENPQSILFPSGVPSPYFPSDAEIASQAEERLNRTAEGNNDLSSEVDQFSEEITQEPVEEQDPTAFGTISRSMGGLEKNIWQPSQIDRIEKLLDAVTLPTLSPVMDDIARKLLLSVTTSPTATPIVEQPLLEDDNDHGFVRAPSFNEDLFRQFINLRLKELIERGNLEDLVAYIQNLPPEILNSEQQNAEILMLGGDLIGACQMTAQARAADTQARNSRFSTNAMMEDDTLSEEGQFWLKMTAFCRVLEQDNSGAQIALDMLNERGSMDFMYNDLLSRLMEPADIRGTFFSGGLNDLEPLNYTIWSLLDQPIDADLIEASDPLIVSALVINPNMSAENRFQAAAKSYLSGGVTSNALRNIYDMQEFTNAEYNSAVRMAEFDERPIADALLYQAASKQMIDLEKAEILEAIWQRAIENNDLPRKAALNIETLRSLNPTTRLVNHAHHIVRGLILGGDIERALLWYDFARRSAASGDAEATRALINIWPLATLAAEPGEIPWSDSILNLWWNGQMVLSPENRDGKATLFYALAEAFGHQVAEDKWAELITENKQEGVQPIPLAVWREMIKAVGENKPAEALLLSLIAMGEEGPGSLDASGLSTIIRLLRSVGLEQEARKVAIEAMVANDF